MGKDDSTVSIVLYSMLLIIYSLPKDQFPSVSPITIIPALTQKHKRGFKTAYKQDNLEALPELVVVEHDVFSCVISSQFQVQQSHHYRHLRRKDLCCTHSIEKI